MLVLPQTPSPAPQRVTGEWILPVTNSFCTNAWPLDGYVEEGRHSTFAARSRFSPRDHERTGPRGSTAPSHPGRYLLAAQPPFGLGPRPRSASQRPPPHPSRARAGSHRTRRAPLTFSTSWAPALPGHSAANCHPTGAGTYSSVACLTTTPPRLFLVLFRGRPSQYLPFTVAILAQGASWAVAVTQASFCSCPL